MGRARIHTRLGRSHGDARDRPQQRAPNPLWRLACGDSPHGGDNTVHVNTAVVVVIACVVVITGAAGMLIAHDGMSMTLAFISP